MLDSFLAIRKSLGTIDAKSMYDPIEGLYAGPNTRIGLADRVISHNADYYGQVPLYLRLNGLSHPPAGNPTRAPQQLLNFLMFLELVRIRTTLLICTYSYNI